jgi:hypothetical protein
MEQEKSKLTQYCVFSAKTIEYEICRKDWRLRKIVDVASRTAINSFFSELAPSRMLRLWPLGPPGRYFNRNGGPSSPATARWAEGRAAGLGFGRPNKLMWRLCESSTSKIFTGHAWRQGSRTRKAVCLTKDDLEIFRFFFFFFWTWATPVRSSRQRQGERNADGSRGIWPSGWTSSFKN